MGGWLPFTKGWGTSHSRQDSGHTILSQVAVPIPTTSNKAPTFFVVGRVGYSGWILGYFPLKARQWPPCPTYLGVAASVPATSNKAPVNMVVGEVGYPSRSLGYFPLTSRQWHPILSQVAVPIPTTSNKAPTFSVLGRDGYS